MSGPVAQLGARFHGMEEVVGSNPTRSTNFPQCLSSRYRTDHYGVYLRFLTSLDSNFLGMIHLGCMKIMLRY